MAHAQRLKPLVVVLGGIRQITVEALHKKRHHTRSRQRRMNGQPAREQRMRETTVILHPAEWKAANRFRKNAAAIIRNITYSTPFGRIALAEQVDALVTLRETALLEAAEHNRRNPRWQILVEGPTWADLSEDAQSSLLTILGGQLPEWCFYDVG